MSFFLTAIVCLDVQAESIRFSTRPHTDSVLALCHRDNILASAGRDLHLILTDTVSGDVLVDLHNDQHRIMITAVQFQDGARHRLRRSQNALKLLCVTVDILVSGSVDGTIIVWCVAAAGTAPLSVLTALRL